MTAPEKMASNENITLPAIFLDSTALRPPRALRGSFFRALVFLAKNYQLKIYVSEITIQECLSGLMTEVRDAASDIETRLAKLASQLGCTFEQTIAAAKESIDSSGVESKDLFENWLSDSQTRTIALDGADAKLVFDAYFGGHAPFSSSKCRDDIPDAFIWQSLRRVQQEDSSVCLVSNDKNLATSAARELKMVVYSSLKELLTGDVLGRVLNRKEVANSRKAIEILPSVLTEKMTSLEELLEMHAQGFDLGYGSLGSESDVIIEGVSLGGELEFAVVGAKFLAPDTLIVDFSALGEALVSYSIGHYEWMSAVEDEGRSISISPCNDHYMDAEEYVAIKMRGTLSIKLGVDNFGKDYLKDAVIHDALINAEYEFEEFEAEV